MPESRGGGPGHPDGVYVNQRICISDRTHSICSASSKDVSHTTSPLEVESSVEIRTNSPVPVQFLFWCNLQSYIFFGSKALWAKTKKNTRAHLCLLGPSKEYILVD